MEKNPLHDIIVRTCLDRTFRSEFIEDPAKVLRRFGIQVPEGISIKVIENKDNDIHIVLPSDPLNEPAGWASGKMAVSPEEITATGLTIKWAQDRMLLAGRITAENAPALCQQLDKVTQDFLIDLREVVFMGSAGLGVFLATQKRLHSNGRKLYLGNVPPTVRNIFSLSGMEPFFQFIDSEPGVGWWMAFPII